MQWLFSHVLCSVGLSLSKGSVCDWAQDQRQRQREIYSRAKHGDILHVRLSCLNWQTRIARPIAIIDDFACQ